MMIPAARQKSAARRLRLNFKANRTPRRVVMMKLMAIRMTKNIIGRLLRKTPPDFRRFMVWMEERAWKVPEPFQLKICQIPEMAKKRSIGAKMQPR